MKICYIVLTHHKFDQALRLVSRLAGPDTSIVMHIDSTAESTAVADFQSRLRVFDRVHYAKRMHGRWGAYAQAMAILNSAQAALDLAEPCDRYILVSGQDYPIKDHAGIRDFFGKHPDREFIETTLLDFSDPDPGWSPSYRFQRYHIWTGKRHRCVPVLRKGAPPTVLYKGSTWWALTRPALSSALQEFKANGKLRRYLRTGFLVDEVYMTTLIMATPFAATVVGENVTFAQWTPTSGPHPKTLKSEDLEQLLASPKLFARKFDPGVDVSLMDQLDALHAGGDCDGGHRSRSR